MAQLPVSEDSTMAGKKNAVGLYITSPVVALAGAFPYNTRLGLVYKQRRRDIRSFRLQGVVDLYDLLDDDGKLSTVIELTDTTMTYLYESDKEMTATLRSGFEWSDPKKAVSAVYGVDLIAGLGYYSYKEKHITYYQDTTANTIRPDFNRSVSEKTIEDYSRQNFYAGIDFTFGCRANIGKSWSMVAQISPEILFSPIRDLHYNIVPHPLVKDESFAVDFRLRLIELLLYYRF
ncbi:MAG: hypothetical protein IT223_08125 [Crocinitomicaceae bacterium]|nr:hypothetical protein [Crocinitomicaceae bacterium]